jgi:hypothetical protein
MDYIFEDGICRFLLDLMFSHRLLNSTVFYSVRRTLWKEVYGCFSVNYCLHYQGQIVCQVSILQEALKTQSGLLFDPKMEVVRSSETSVNFCHNVQRRILEGSTLHLFCFIVFLD